MGLGQGSARSQLERMVFMPDYSKTPQRRKTKTAHLNAACSRFCVLSSPPKVPTNQRLRARAMNVTLKPFDFAQAAARAGLAPNGQPLKAAVPAGGADFQQALTQALKSVSATQNAATRMGREVQFDNPTVSIEETMIAMQKAQIGFQATLQVRNRLVQAYSDIMNMQV